MSEKRKVRITLHHHSERDAYNKWSWRLYHNDERGVYTTKVTFYQTNATAKANARRLADALGWEIADDG